MKLIDPHDLTDTERADALRALGQRWTDILIDLSTGPRPLGHTSDVIAVASAVAPFAHPLLTLERIADLMTGFSAALQRFDTYESFGTWDDEIDDSMACRSDDERAAYLDDDASWWLFGLQHATEPCVDCVKYRPASKWQCKQGQYLRCAGHEVVWRSAQDEHRRLMSLR